MNSNRIASGITALALVACGNVPSSPLEAALDSARLAQPAPGAQMSITSPETGWHAATGVADLDENLPLTPEHPVRVGSITKIFTAVIVLQLAEEGRLDVEDPAARYLPELASAGDISVRNLLNHTSGLFNYTEAAEFPAEMNRRWTPTELLGFALARKPAFAPGKGWGYSNTNFIALGLLIERLTGDTYRNVLRARIIDRLGLTATFLAGPEESDTPLARGYGMLPPPAVDATDALDPSLVWAAGSLVSTTRDLTTFGRAMLEHRLISAASYRRMIDDPQLMGVSPAYPGWVMRYGLGVMIADTPHGFLVGHQGGIPGYAAWLGWEAATAETHAVAVTTTQGLPIRMVNAVLPLFPLHAAVEGG